MQSAADRIFIDELELRLHIGVSEAERSFPQRVLLSVGVVIPAGKAAYSGNLSDTVCYATVAQLCQELGQSRHWVLVEEFLEVLASRIFEQFSAALEVSCRASKFVVPHTSAVGVEISRMRPRAK